MNTSSGFSVRHRFPARITKTIALGLLLISMPATPLFAKERVLHEELAAEQIDAIVLTGGNGSARILVGDEDIIKIRVEVRPEKWSDNEPWQKIKDWFLSSAYEDMDDLMDAIRLDADPSQRGKLKLGLTPPVRTRESKVREDWQITVPERLSVKLKMSHATAEIQGVAGGVDISLGNGSADVDVPGGDLDVALLVGKAQVRTGSESVGELSVQSQVGNTRLWMKGMKVKYPKPPGPGSHVSLSGNGEDDISIFVQVGDASLRVNDQ
jgi:hypothetical protein